MADLSRDCRLSPGPPPIEVVGHISVRISPEPQVFAWSSHLTDYWVHDATLPVELMMGAGSGRVANGSKLLNALFILAVVATVDSQLSLGP